MRGNFDNQLPARSMHGHWRPGQSANPGGRPAIEKDVIALARDNSLDSIRTLIAIRDDITAPHGIRVFAANSILDRAIGKVREFPASDDQDRVEMVEALVTALRVGGIRTTRHAITLDMDESDG